MLLASLAAPAQSKAPATPGVAVTSSSGPTTTVPLGTAFTLTAPVTPAPGTIKVGQVTFCDAAGQNLSQDSHSSRFRETVYHA